MENNLSDKMTNATLATELQEISDGTRKFPYECTDAFLTEVKDIDDTFYASRANYELMIRKSGNALVAIPREDENGNPVTHKKTGRTMLDFVYTLGNGRRGIPEVLCFYPSTTIGFSINRLCEKMRNGEVQVPAEGEVTEVLGCFEDESLNLKLVLTPLTGKSRQVAQDRYCCQCEEDDQVLLCFAPYPDGNFDVRQIPDDLLAL